MNILVTGGAGFIGSHLCKKLVDEGNFVICLDDLSTGSKDNISDMENDKEKFTFKHADLNDLDKVKAVFGEHDIDTIFHYAATVGVLRTLDNPLRVLDDALHTRNLLELSRKHDIKRFIYASSSEVYGEPVEMPEKEDGIKNPDLMYAVSKLMSEKYCDAFFQKYGINTTSFRFFNTYGPRQDSSSYGFVVGIFLKQALKNEQLTIFGDGSQTRDFTFIEDNICPVVESVKLASTFGKSINIGTGKEISVLELADAVNEVVGNKNEHKFLPKRDHEIMRRCADVSLMKKLIGYEPKVDIKTGLKKTMRWYNDKG